MWDPCVEHATNSCLACRFCKFWQKPMWIHPENGFKGFGVIGIIEGEKKSTTKTLLLNPYQAWTISLHCTLAVITPSLQKLGWLGAAGVVLNAKHNERLYIIILWVSEYLEGILWRLGSRWLGVCRWCKLQATAKVSFVSFRNMFREMWFRIPGHWSQVTMVLVGRIQEVPECANVFFFLGGCGEKNGTNHLEASNIGFREVCDAVVELDSSMNIAEDVHRLGAWLAHGRPTKLLCFFCGSGKGPLPRPCLTTGNL